ncbi:MAG TPA: YidC/Oxa1 family membrane protein insertase [Limnochordia bacterium]|nr:YidC/Oxa1 family membrane protein insertase [Limnochordia bacterium]
MQLFLYLESFMRETLVWFYGLTHSYGVAVILITLLIRGVLSPLTFHQSKSMAKMKALQPQLKALQEKHKSDPKVYQQKMMQVYKENKVNPFGGCLPMLVQLPFLWALFQVLRHFDFNTQFLIWNLSDKDPYYILPLLAAGTTFIQSVMTISDPQQRMIAYIMPVFIGWIATGFPVGLVIYWIVSNVFTIVQQWWIYQRLPELRGGARTK